MVMGKMFRSGGIVGLVTLAVLNCVDSEEIVLVVIIMESICFRM